MYISVEGGATDLVLAFVCRQITALLHKKKKKKEEKLFEGFIELEALLSNETGKTVRCSTLLVEGIKKKTEKYHK